MRLTVRILGVEVFHVSTDADDEQTEAGDCTSYPIGFSTPDPTPHEFDCPERDL